MARGGYRPGAGRKKAADGCLRVKADAGQVTPGSGQMPLDYMLMIMRDPEVDPVRRDRMAIAAAPFVHPRMYDNRVGKKDVEAEAAKTATRDSDWGNDLEFERPN